jgi:hypothetical protein
MQDYPDHRVRHTERHHANIQESFNENDDFWKENRLHQPSQKDHSAQLKTPIVKALFEDCIGDHY